VPGADRPRPFLKWAGGKRQLLPALRPFYPEQFTRYIEPFLGSGAVYFDLHGLGLLEGRDVVLMDRNADLVGCYLAVRDSLPEVTAALEELADGHKTSGARFYYEVRDERFNPARRALANGTKGAGTITPYPPALAAMFIYLNRTGYNGLFRLNASGAFNVPVGRYIRPRISDPANLALVAAALRSRTTRVQCADFPQMLEIAEAGDFIYMDPPYAPVSRTSRFTSYTASGFSLDDQRTLRDVAVALAERGCAVTLSNSTAPEILELYDGDARVRAAGLRGFKVPARRAINAKSAARGPVQEFVVTNVCRRSLPV
jgi:DNA adenine methylase